VDFTDKSAASKITGLYTNCQLMCSCWDVLL
jgi:hypothetical protein